MKEVSDSCTFGLWKYTRDPVAIVITRFVAYLRSAFTPLLHHLKKEAGIAFPLASVRRGNTYCACLQERCAITTLLRASRTSYRATGASIRDF